MKDVTIVIVSFNTNGLLRACLSAIFDQTKLKSFEIVVVDNASEDGSADMVEDIFPDVKIIRNDRNLGFARACNIGIDASRGDYVLLLNPDTRIIGDAISEAISFMETKPDAGMTACRMIGSDQFLQIGSGYTNVRLYRLLRALRTAINGSFRLLASTTRIDPLELMYQKSREVKWIIGAFMLVRRETIADVGKLDEKFFLYGGGESTAKVPSTKVVDWFVESNQYLLAKHYGKLRCTYWFATTLIESYAKAAAYELMRILFRKNQSVLVKRDLYKYKAQKVSHAFRKFLRNDHRGA